MKENFFDVLMYLFENYFYEEPEEQPDRDSLEQNLHEAGFTNGEIEKAFNWLDGLAEQLASLIAKHLLNLGIDKPDATATTHKHDPFRGTEMRQIHIAGQTPFTLPRPIGFA